MNKFLSKYPQAGFWLITVLMALIGFLGQQALTNNTKAMEKLALTIERIIDSNHKQDIQLTKFDGRLKALEK